MVRAGIATQIPRPTGGEWMHRVAIAGKGPCTVETDSIGDVTEASDEQLSSQRRAADIAAADVHHYEHRAPPVGAQVGQAKRRTRSATTLASSRQCGDQCGLRSGNTRDRHARGPW